MCQVPRPALESRAGLAAPHAAAFTKLLNIARCQFGSGRKTACRLSKSRKWFPRGLESVYSPTKLPEPGGRHHRPVLRWLNSPSFPLSRESSDRSGAGHGSLGLYLSAQAKNSVGRAPTSAPNHQPDTAIQKPNLKQQEEASIYSRSKSSFRRKNATLRSSGDNAVNRNHTEPSGVSR